MPVAVIHYGVLDSMSGVWCRHMYFDAEQQGDAWAVVLRGEDKAKVGSKSNKPAALQWNDASGEHVPFTLATITGTQAKERASELAQAMIGFYGAEGKPFSERVAKLDAEGMALALMVAAVTSARPHANKESHWRVGSIAGTLAAKRLARERADRASAIAKITACTKDPKAMDELAEAVQSAEEIAALEAIVLARKAEILARK
ncbi:MAG: hypothetical protein ACM359_09510 [Bacillota bacterium]